MNSRGQFDVARKTIYWAIISVVITMIVMAYAFIVVGYKERLTAYPPELTAELISLRFTSLPECFAYQDALQRVHKNTLDLEKFSVERMNDCYSTEKEFGYRDMNFRLQLASDATKSLQTNNYYNVDHFTLHRDILVYNDGKAAKDELLIYVQNGIAVRPGLSTAERIVIEKASKPLPSEKI